MSNYSKFKKKDAPKGKLSIGGNHIDWDYLSPGQRGAFDVFKKWFEKRKKDRQPILRIGGSAGAGKSTWLKYIVDYYGWDRTQCYVMSYTGQSVNVLRTMGIYSSTIHSVIMTPQEVPVYGKDGKPIMRRGVQLTEVKFRPIKRVPPSVELFIIDEASFLPEDLEKTLLRYNVPILEIGDPIQLPPVAGKQVFMTETLDYFIEGVMRQNKDNEIYILGNQLRNGEHIESSNYCREVRFLHQQPTIEDTFMRYLPMFRDADAIVCCTNKQRQIITELYREVILKTSSPFPITGERMICRRNNPVMTLGDFMLTNGMQGYCMHKVGRSMVDPATDTFFMDFHPDVVSNEDLFYDNLLCDTEYLKKPFGGSNLESFRHPGNKFEFAHALTAHIVQGATYNKVVFMDSFNMDKEYLNRVRYTGITRARYKVWFMIPYKGEWTL